MLRCLFLLGVLASATGCDRGPKSEAATTSSGPAVAAAPTSPGKSTSFGAGVTVAETTSIDKILAEPTAWNGKTVRVEGLVVDVCPKRGCWFEMAGEGTGAKLRFKVTDGEMVFP
nr:hypothetical protein [Deltaproteobacteria bacterium]